MTQVSIDQALEIAFGHHEAGRLAAAEGIYRQILVHFPNAAGAWHWMGVRASEAGRLQVAIELIGRAIGIDSTVFAMHCNLGEACLRAGQSEWAIASLRRAIALEPDVAEVHNTLGNALSDRGSLDEAIAAGERDGIGMGEALGRRLNELSVGQALSPAMEASLVLQAYRHGTPVTVHVAVGTDTPHMHPAADGAADRGRLELLPRFAGVARVA